MTMPRDLKPLHHVERPMSQTPNGAPTQDERIMAVVEAIQEATPVSDSWTARPSPRVMGAIRLRALRALGDYTADADRLQQEATVENQRLLAQLRRVRALRVVHLLGAAIVGAALTYLMLRTS